jgi:hypothetical protein
VSYDGTLYVENIVYDAKGQRLLIAYGNGMMTRYVYNTLTFRLLRQCSEKYTKSTVGCLKNLDIYIEDIFQIIAPDFNLEFWPEGMNSM